MSNVILKRGTCCRRRVGLIDQAATQTLVHTTASVSASFGQFLLPFAYLYQILRIKIRRAQIDLMAISFRKEDLDAGNTYQQTTSQLHKTLRNITLNIRNVIIPFKIAQRDLRIKPVPAQWNSKSTLVNRKETHSTVGAQHETTSQQHSTKLHTTTSMPISLFHSFRIHGKTYTKDLHI